MFRATLNNTNLALSHINRQSIRFFAMQPSSAGKATSSPREYTPKDSLLKRVLHVRKVTRVNSGGKMRSVSAVVIVGDQNGSAGVGMGRGIDTQLAVAKASAQAEKNMTPFPRLENRTIFSDIDYKFHNVNLKLGMAKPGTRVNLGHGIVANNYIHEICRCIGISDMTGKVYGSNNPMNVIKGTFAALASQKRPDEIALARGKKVMDVERTYYGTRLS